MAKNDLHIPGDWMYHAPEKPVPMQIENPPSDFFNPPDEPEYDEPRRQYFKDTDTPYVRMAKEGGRKDLIMQKPSLEFRPSAERVPYQRCDWYYLDDIAAQEAADRSKQPGSSSSQHVPRAPDYMVYDPETWAEVNRNANNSSAANPQKKARIPYATLNASQLEAQEAAQQRNTSKVKQTNQPRVTSNTKSSASSVQRSKPIVPKSELESPASRFVPLRPNPEDKQAQQKVDMTKILANEYADDFNKQRADWQKRQTQADARRASNPNASKAPSASKLTTEYRSNVGKTHK